MYGPNGPYDDFGDDCMPDDVSMRVNSYTNLLRALSNRNIDARLRAEGMQMLERVRRTVRIPPRGQLHSVPLANENKERNPTDSPAIKRDASKTPTPTRKPPVKPSKK